jgi:multiple sugar transport system permease protein
VDDSRSKIALRFPHALHPRLYPQRLCEALIGYLFIAPAVLLITLFGLFPLGYALYMSLYRWHVRQGAFIGLKNYIQVVGHGSGALLFCAGLALLALAYGRWNRMRRRSSQHRGFRRAASITLLIGGVLGLSMGWSRMATSGDVKFLHAIPVTVYYALGSIPVQLVLALALAYGLFQNLRGTTFFRMVFFLPYVMPTVATATVFRTIFSPRDTSLANQILALVGLQPQQWLADPRPVLEVLFGWHLSGMWSGPSLALASIIAFGVWTFVGYNVVIFLAGLSTISPYLYESARMDGANNWHLFRYITLPLLSPVTFYLALIDFIGALKAFNHIFVMRTPLAQETVNTVSVVVFDTFYKANKFGYAAAQVILLFLMILGVTYVQYRVFGRRVIYD